MAFSPPNRERLLALIRSVADENRQHNEQAQEQAHPHSHEEAIAFNENLGLLDKEQSYLRDCKAVYLISSNQQLSK
jgi:hypothetical protein